MTPIEFGVSRSKVKVTVTFKLRGAYMFHKHFLFNVVIVFKFELNSFCFRFYIWIIKTNNIKF